MPNSKPVLGLYDKVMWEAMNACVLKLQCCDACHQYRYPPASHCPNCLNDGATWKAVSRDGTIMSWVIFRRQYFDDHPAPYNSIAVRLDEGPIIVSQLRGEEPSTNWIGLRVKLEIDYAHGRGQHFARLI